MKVVINTCYGGFGLSDAVVERCVALGMTVTTFGPDGNGVDRAADFIRNDEDTKSLARTSYYAHRKDEKAFRTHPAVVAAVEELGSAANGMCAELKVIDIPFDGLEGWEIEEYDGKEWVEPVHERWS